MSRLGAFCRTSVGAFVRSVLGARACPTGCGPVVLGGCCTQRQGGYGCIQNVTQQWCDRVRGKYLGDFSTCRLGLNCYIGGPNTACCVSTPTVTQGGYYDLKRCLACHSDFDDPFWPFLTTDIVPCSPSNCDRYNGYGADFWAGGPWSSEFFDDANDCADQCADLPVFNPDGKCCFLNDCVPSSRYRCSLLGGMWDSPQCSTGDGVGCLGSCCLGECSWCIDGVTRDQCNLLMSSSQGRWSRGSVCQAAQCP